MKAKSFLFAFMLAGAVLLLAAGGASAQASITAEKPSCFKTTDNQVVHATTAGEPAGDSARFYFRWEKHGPFYWVDLEHDGAGKYWVVPPKPERRNTEIEYYGVLLDPAGREAARSQTQVVKVTQDCRVQLTPQQFGVAQNLTIGETDKDQEKKSVLGFLCDGIVTRINPEKIRRADETCRACVVAWWQNPGIFAPIAVAGSVGGITTIIIDRPEPSPSRP